VVPGWCCLDLGWVLDVAGFDLEADRRVLDVGCGTGNYLSQPRRRGVLAVGCDMSFGMLGAARPHPALVQADVTALPLGRASFDLVLVPHMLYHVDDREQAAAELHRVTAPGGCCVVVTNGTEHMRSLRSLLEAAVRRATSDWEMRHHRIVHRQRRHRCLHLPLTVAQIGRRPQPQSAGSSGFTQCSGGVHCAHDRSHQGPSDRRRSVNRSPHARIQSTSSVE